MSAWTKLGDQDLYYMARFYKNGYYMLLTDFVHVWEETADRADIMERMQNSIQLKDMKVPAFIEMLKTKMAEGLTSFTTSKKGSSMMQLSLDARIDELLRLKWDFEFEQIMDNDALRKYVIIPLLRATGHMIRAMNQLERTVEEFQPTLLSTAGKPRRDLDSKLLDPWKPVSENGALRDTRFQGIFSRYVDENLEVPEAVKVIEVDPVPSDTPLTTDNLQQVSPPSQEQKSVTSTSKPPEPPRIIKAAPKVPKKRKLF